MASEVFNNQPYGAGADIYSLGLVLYWMLIERRLPFMPLPPVTPNLDMEEEERQHRFHGEAIPEPKHGGEALKRIVLKACAFDPKDRYQSAKEMLLELDALGDPAHAVETNPTAQSVTAESTMGEGTVGLFCRSVQSPESPMPEDGTMDIFLYTISVPEADSEPDKQAAEDGENTPFGLSECGAEENVERATDSRRQRTALAAETKLSDDHSTRSRSNQSKKSKWTLWLSIGAAALALAVVWVILGIPKNSQWDWSLNDGVLTISGTGEMHNYSNTVDSPCTAQTEKIVGIVIEDGITSIGDFSFRGCANAEKVSIPESVKRIGKNAFYMC